jgi:hypothetical protein
VTPDAWRTAAPPPRALGEPPRVVDDRHERRLAAWRPVRLTASLGHGTADGGAVRDLLGHVQLTLLVTAPTARPDPATAAEVTRLRGLPAAAAFVRRDAGVDAAARALGAAAFTHDGVVYLPDRHGPPGAPAVRALLAHELPHVAQHARAVLDPAHRPRPNDGAARERLEAEAREVARRTARTAERPEQPPHADVTGTFRHTATPVEPAAGPPDDAALDRQARLLYPRVRALLDADHARDQQRAGRHPAGW